MMVEAKCVEIRNKQATLRKADPGAHPKFNNEQWQALIALHRTLLHEHYTFFPAGQYPCASEVDSSVWGLLELSPHRNILESGDSGRGYYDQIWQIRKILRRLCGTGLDTSAAPKRTRPLFEMLAETLPTDQTYVEMSIHLPL
jgi:hypothetical protein